MLLPRALLHNRDARGKRRAEPIDSGPSLLNYGGKQPSIPSSWDGVHHALSIFRTDETSKIDAINIAQSISRIIDYIKSSLVSELLKVDLNFSFPFHFSFIFLFYFRSIFYF